MEYGQPLFVWLSRDWPSVRTCVRTYASTDCTGGVGETIKRKGGWVRRVLTNPHLLYWTFTIRSTDHCQNRIATDQYHKIISRARVSTHRGDVIYLEAPADQLIVLLDRNQCSIQGGKLLPIHSLKWNPNDVLTTCKAISKGLGSGFVYWSCALRQKP